MFEDDCDIIFVISEMLVNFIEGFVYDVRYKGVRLY